MILERFYEESLAHASFLVGCGVTHEAIVIDPNRDIEVYRRAAKANGLKIVAVTETHIHADFVSGTRELAASVGARAYLSDEGDADWKYGFAGEPNVTLVKGGDTIRVGNVRLDVLATPGHTPEHIAFVLTDEPASAGPLGVFTGDFVFVGDVGRPDLLERAANMAGTMERGARTMFRSLQAFKQQPGHLLLWPSHGAGSACGKNLGGVPVSTLAYEKVANWGLRATDEAAFVAEILAGQPEPPVYFKEMKRVNRDGRAPLGGFKTPARIDGAAVLAMLERGERVVDARPVAAFAAGFVPGTLSIATGKSFVGWAGWLVPYDRPVAVIADRESAAAARARDLALIGIERVAGWATAEDVLAAWQASGHTPETMTSLPASEAFEGANHDEITLLDVRGAGEYADGHVPGVRHIPLGYLAERAAELPRDRVVAALCGGGSRSGTAVSVLRGLGFTKVVNVPGGYPEFRNAGVPVERGDPVTQP